MATQQQKEYTMNASMIAKSYEMSDKERAELQHIAANQYPDIKSGISYPELKLEIAKRGEQARAKSLRQVRNFKAGV